MAISKRKARRDRGRAQEEAALRRRYPEHYFVKGPGRLAVSARDIKATTEFLMLFEGLAQAHGAGRPILLDLHETAFIDAAGCVLLASAMQRLRLSSALTIDVRMPRNGSARFALSVFGVADDGRPTDELFDQFRPQIMKVSSGMKGDLSPGARTFEVARLAEGLVADEMLADRVHAALNEAADNVLSWAYDQTNDDGDPTQRWWVAGVLSNRTATFIALDHGAGIPATAPKNFGDALTGMLASMISEKKEWLPINRKPSDSQILLATIRQRRTVSGLDERGKGLNSMIALIDLFPAGFINIFSGDAIYGYCKPAPKGRDGEDCSALGFQFPGTLIVWQLKAQ